MPVMERIRTKLAATMCGFINSQVSLFFDVHCCFHQILSDNGFITEKLLTMQIANIDIVVNILSKAVSFSFWKKLTLIP